MCIYIYIQGKEGTRARWNKSGKGARVLRFDSTERESIYFLAARAATTIAISSVSRFVGEAEEKEDEEDDGEEKKTEHGGGGG